MKRLCAGKFLVKSLNEVKARLVGGNLAKIMKLYENLRFPHILADELRTIENLIWLGYNLTPWEFKNI